MNILQESYRCYKNLINERNCDELNDTPIHQLRKQNFFAWKILSASNI